LVAECVGEGIDGHGVPIVVATSLGANRECWVPRYIAQCSLDNVAGRLPKMSSDSKFPIQKRLRDNGDAIRNVSKFLFASVVSGLRHLNHLRISGALVLGIEMETIVH
jgi:hypothetical protein